MSAWIVRATLILVAIITSGAPSLAAAADLWTGTWKLDGGKSLSVPPALTIEQSGSHYVIQSSSRREVDCNGRDYPESGGTLRCVAEKPALVLMLREGSIRTRSSYRLGADGGTLVETVRTVWPEQPPTTEIYKYRRAAPSHALAGSWVGVPSVPVAQKDALELRVHDGWLRFRDVEDGQVTDAKLDGTPVPFSSPGLPAGAGWSNILVNDRQILGFSLQNDARSLAEIFTLSPDGKVMTVISPRRPGSYDTFVKQEGARPAA